MWAVLARFEWILIEVIVLGILVWQLVSIRRAVKRDRENAKAAQERGPPPPSG